MDLNVHIEQWQIPLHVNLPYIFCFAPLVFYPGSSTDIEEPQRSSKLTLVINSAKTMSTLVVETGDKNHPMDMNMVSRLKM